MTTYDCIVAGTCVLDVVCRPCPLGEPIGAGVLRATAPLAISGGGVCTNAGAAMARLGLRVGVFSAVGSDPWAEMLRDIYRREGIAEHLIVHPSDSTSTTVALVDPSGERSFLHYPGACSRLTADDLRDRADLWGQSSFLLLGYYSLLPELGPRLPETLAEVRRSGCRVAFDDAGAGGALAPLTAILPHVDCYIPSHGEAERQTGRSDPREIVAAYRRCGAAGLLGVKLGNRGVLLSPAEGDFIEVGVRRPPGAVLDTTGAGDCFYAGLLAGILRGLSVEESGRLGAATAACCVTSLGGYAGTRDYAFTASLAGLENVRQPEA
jgi:sugar/nucleoside kinase (ribokinase family)